MTKTAGQKMMTAFKKHKSELTRAELIELEIELRGAMSALPFETYSETDQAYINAADENSRDGEIEIDTCSTVVSESSDGGAYVQAWFWVDDADAGLNQEDEDEDDEISDTGPDGSVAQQSSNDGP